MIIITLFYFREVPALPGRILNGFLTSYAHVTLRKTQISPALPESKYIHTNML